MTRGGEHGLLCRDDSGAVDSFTTGMQYDGHYGRLKALAYPNGLTVAYGYNARGYKTQTRNAASGYVYREISAASPRGQCESATLAEGTYAAVRSFDANTGWARGWRWASRRMDGTSISPMTICYSHIQAVQLCTTARDHMREKMEQEQVTKSQFKAKALEYFRQVETYLVGW